MDNGGCRQGHLNDVSVRCLMILVFGFPHSGDVYLSSQTLPIDVFSDLSKIIHVEITHPELFTFLDFVKFL